MHVKRPFARSMPGSLLTMAQMRRDLRLRGLADEQPLALAAEERGHQGEQDPDRDRSDAVEDGTLEELRRQRPRQRDEQAEDGRVSSNRTMNVVGSLLRRAASRKLCSPFSPRNSLKATLQERPRRRGPARAPRSSRRAR
jgi:hypothetical protein